MGALNQQVALVTGGASGLGRAIVDRYVEEGARVLVFDRSADRLEALVSELKQQDDDSRVAVFAGDVRSLADNRAAVAACLEAFDGLDVAVGNAGIWDYSRSLDSLQDDELGEAFDEMFHINVKGYLLLAKACLPSLVKSEGSLIYTVSNAGFYPNGGGPLYTASKHAVVGLIRQLAFEFAPAVRVNGVAPGPIGTDLRGPEAMGMAERSIQSINLPEFAASAVPTHRVPSPAEYTGGYVLYASRRDQLPATGGVFMADTGIGVRGVGVVSGGDKLKDKYGG